MGIIKDHIGEAAMWEQLAEECSELCKESLKVARVLRDENPTNRDYKGSVALALGEYADVVQCAEECGLFPLRGQIRSKEQRFIQRWEIAHERLSGD